MDEYRLVETVTERLYGVNDAVRYAAKYHFGMLSNVCHYSLTGHNLLIMQQLKAVLRDFLDLACLTLIGFKIDLPLGFGFRVGVPMAHVVKVVAWVTWRQKPLLKKKCHSMSLSCHLMITCRDKPESCVCI